MKRLVLMAIFSIALLFGGREAAAQPKYVFYFIGDGMGMNIIHAAELYKASQNGSKDYKSDLLNFSQFPVIGILNTSSADSFITDSAAAGTAMSSGEKTNKGVIGLASDNKRELVTIADKFKSESKGVAIVTTVGIDHATPAAFYAHNVSRNNYYEIAVQGINSNFDILGGAGFNEIVDSEEKNNIYSRYKRGGYKHIKGRDRLSKIKENDTKLLITERDGVPQDALSLAVDRDETDLTLTDLVSVSIEHLYDNYEEEGFMIMAEAGQIDWCGHSNDFNGAVNEVLDLESAVAVALKFYHEHPEETLIIVTADHETGGYGNGRTDGGYVMDFSRVKSKVQSVNSYRNMVKDLVKNNTPFNELPLPRGFEFNAEELKEIEEAYNSNEDFKKRLYNFIDIVYNSIDRAVGAGWTTTGHTGSPVMVFSVGEGADEFSGHLDNTDLPKLIEKLAL